MTNDVRLSIGGNNVCDKLPPPVAAAVDTVDRNGDRFPLNTPWGNLGAHFYVKFVASY